MKRIAQMLAWGTAAVAFAAGRIATAQAPQGYLPASEVAKETVPAMPLLYGAYAFVWVALVVYVFLLWRRLSRIEREMADVTARLAGRK